MPELFHVDCPAGTVRQTVAVTADPGWLLMDGATVTRGRLLYPALWNVIPASWQSGDDILLPDTTDKFITGAGSTAVGATGGSATVTLDADNIPEHTHPQVAHSHAIDHNHASVTSGGHSADHSHGVNINTGTESAYHQHGTGDGTYTHFVVQGFSGGASGVATLNAGIIGPNNITQTGNQNALHYHNVNGNTGGASADHTHSVDLPNFTGSTPSDGATTTDVNTTAGDAVDITPPHLALVYQIRAY